MRKDIYKYVIRFIGIVILISILWNSNLSMIWKSVRDTNLILLLLSFLFVIPTMFLKSVRWAYALKKIGLVPNMTSIFLMYMSGIFIGLITPGRIGDVIRVYYFEKDSRVKVFFTVLLDRAYDLFILISLAYLGFLLFFSKFSATIILMSILLAILLIGSIIALASWGKLREITGKFFVFFLPKRFGGHAKAFVDTAHRFGAREYMVMLICTLISYIFYYLVYYFAALSLGLDLNLVFLVSILAITSIVTFLPISFLGFGTRDISLIFLLGLIGVGKETAIAFSVIILAVNLVAALYGFLCWLAKPVSLHS